MLNTLTSVFAYDGTAQRTVANAVAGRPVRYGRVSAGFYGATRLPMPCVLRETSPNASQTVCLFFSPKGMACEQASQEPITHWDSSGSSVPPNDLKDVRRPP